MSEKLRELIAKSVSEIHSTLSAIRDLYSSPGRGGLANCQLTWPEIRIYLMDIAKELSELEAALAAEPGQDNCKEYALGHKDGVAWCRKALNKAIEERGAAFAVHFLDEYLAFPVAGKASR